MLVGNLRLREGDRAEHEIQSEILIFTFFRTTTIFAVARPESRLCLLVGQRERQAWQIYTAVYFCERFC